MIQLFEPRRKRLARTVSLDRDVVYTGRVRRRPGPFVTILLLGSSCGTDEDAFVFTDSPWSDADVIVHVEVELSGRPTEANPPIFSPREAVRVVVDPGSKRRSFLYAFPPSVRAPSGKSLEECGVQTSEARFAPALNEARAWVFDHADVGDVAPTLRESDPVLGPRLYFQECGEPISQCGTLGIEVETFEFPERVTAQTVDLDPDNVGHIGAVFRDTLSSTIAIQLWRWSPGDVAPELIVETSSTADPDRFEILSLRSGFAGGFIGAWTEEGPDGGHLFRLASTGERIPFAHQPGRGVSVGSDGIAFTVLPDQNEARRIEGDRIDPVPDFPPGIGIGGLSVVREQRILAPAKLSFAVRDESDFRIEKGPLSDLSNTDADEEIMVAVGDLELVVLRDAATKAWEVIDRPNIGSERLRDVAAMGGRRFLVVAENGRASIRLGQEWCEISMDNRDLLRRVAATPTQALLMTARRSNEGSAFRAKLIRVRFAPPN